MENTKVFYSYTKPQLEEAFKRVQNKEHWKNPIDALIDEKYLDITDKAIQFFTGTAIKSNVKEGNKLHIKADGYFLGPCN